MQEKTITLTQSELAAIFSMFGRDAEFELPEMMELREDALEFAALEEPHYTAYQSGGEKLKKFMAECNG